MVFVLSSSIEFFDLQGEGDIMPWIVGALQIGKELQ
jgi:hypothetical protein